MTRPFFAPRSPRPFARLRRGSPRRAAMTLVELLIVVAILGLLMALLLPAVQAAREASRRAQCANNLHQIGLAMHAFDETHQRLPGTETWYPDESAPAGKRFTGGSAFVLLLPYLDQGSLASRYNIRLSISAAANKPLTEITLPVLTCPSMVFQYGGEPSPGWSSYAVSTGSNYGHFANQGDPEYHNGAIVDPQPRGVATRRRRTSVGDISGLDGATHTFLAGDLDYGLSNIAAVSGSAGGEFGGSTRWTDAYPFSCQASTAGVFNSTRIVTPFLEWYTFRSDHPGGVNMLMVDGSARFVGETTSPITLKNLAKCDDAQPIGEY
ncbi:MAG: DUF1559 domain-containing protein [Planctomycetaceae bacterium]|nr:DUF1559 domain-containing protein [Planctomycetaceae bacterium]